jgi:sugar/nucleoside kinase (ribokinase family)
VLQADPVAEPAKKPFDLVVVGDANPDVVLHDVPAVMAFGQAEQLVSAAALTVGGSGAIVAHAAARLGLRTAFVGLTGDDDAGRMVLGRLAAAGVDISRSVVRAGVSTAMTVVLVRPGSDRAILTAPGALAQFDAADVDPGLLTSSRHVHVSATFLQPALQGGLPELLAIARAGGATTSLDTNDDPSGQWRIEHARLLNQVDHLLPNAREVLALAPPGPDGEQPASVVQAARVLHGFGPTVVVKCGAEGALLVDADGERFARLSGAPPELVDTIGAGDTFDAGFVAGLLGGLAPADALRLAVAAGTLSTRAGGGVDGQPDLGVAWELAGSVLVTTGEG